MARYNQEKRRQTVREAAGDASMADTIAYNVKRVIHHRMDEDPAFYKKFWEMLQEVIDAFRSERLAEAEYLNRAIEIEQAVLNRTDVDLSAVLKTHNHNRDFYALLARCLPDWMSRRERLNLAAVLN